MSRALEGVVFWLLASIWGNTRDVNLSLFGRIPLFFFTFRLFKTDFPLFLKNRKQKIFFPCTDTATIDCSKSFSEQSVTSWFAGRRFFRFRSKFESTDLHSHSKSEYSDARSHAACWCTAWTAWTRERGG